MPKSPRLQVVLPEEIYRDLARIARYTDKSMSALVSQMVKDAAPVLHQLADTLEEAHGISMQLPGGLAAKFDALGKVAEQLEHGTQELLDQVQENAADRREEQGEKRPRGPASQGKTL